MLMSMSASVRSTVDDDGDEGADVDGGELHIGDSAPSGDGSASRSAVSAGWSRAGASCPERAAELRAASMLRMGCWPSWSKRLSDGCAAAAEPGGPVACAGMAEAGASQLVGVASEAGRGVSCSHTHMEDCCLS